MTQYAKVTVKFHEGHEKAFGLLPEDVLFYREVTEGAGIEVLHVSGEWLYANTQEPITEIQQKSTSIPGIVDVVGVKSSEEEAEEWVQTQD